MRPILITIFSFFILTVHAQNMSWKKHAKLAEQLYENKEYKEAAEHYEAAWQKKTKKKEYIFNAAECYYKIKDFRKAAEAYQYVQEDNDEFELAGLKYGRALKMDGQYDEASRAFVYFINGYQGDDKNIVASIVQDEIRGCELGMSLLQGEKESDITLEHLSKNVNSSEGDFAPVPFSDDVLYYTSNMLDETKIYLSQRHGGVWSKARVPKNFPKIDAKHFGNGAFSPDNKRFFYTQCNQVDVTGRMFNGCAIYVTERDDSGWNQPKKLRSYINKNGSTSTHPFVIHRDGKEILFFVSDCSGGQGGLDIWMTTRDLTSDEMDFESPTNLGKAVNTPGDEVTPFYDSNDKVLYFSSNAGVNIGGFDIFQSKNSSSENWEKPENIGLPYNSSVDDYYYRKSTPFAGYLVSNRKTGLEKSTTKDDDIFSFSKPDEKMAVTGKIMVEASGELVANANVNIYEITTEGKIRLLESKVSTDGNYEFALLPGKKYRVETDNEGYLVNGIEFNTVDDSEKRNFVGDIKIKENNGMVNESGDLLESGELDGEFIDPQPTEGLGEDESFATSGETRTEASIPAPVNTSPLNNEAKVVYKIQLIAVRSFNQSDSRYRLAKNYGKLETESLESKNLTRVLLTGFGSKTEAEEILEEMKQQKDFRSAVVVRYENGVRIDPWAK